MNGFSRIALKRAACLSALLLAMPAGAMLVQAPWVNGRPALETGDMLLEGCLRPGVESSCKMLNAKVPQTYDGNMRPTGPAATSDYGVARANPMPEYDRPLVLIARPAQGRARICGGPAIEITNWYYSNSAPPCPERPFSPFDD